MNSHTENYKWKFKQFDLKHTSKHKHTLTRSHKTKY